MTHDDFNLIFDHATSSVFRYEGLPVYDVDAEDEDLTAWREGRGMAERSVRTSPWLARIARRTVVDGVSWRRVRYAAAPLSWYIAWEVESYVESQAAGDQTFLTDQQVWSGPDFWLIDAGLDRAHAVLMHYTDSGEFIEYEPVDHGDPRMPSLERAVEHLVSIATPLNDWIAAHRSELRGAEARG